MLPFTAMPLWLAAFLLVAVPAALAMAGPIVVRRYIKLDRLRTNNEVAGFKFATVGVIYAVLLAFAVLVVWEKFNEAEVDVAREASAAATIFRLSVALPAEYQEPLRAALTAYLETAIRKDWPAMEEGRASPETTRALSALYPALLKPVSGERVDPVLLGELLRQLDEISAARRSRLVASSGTVPPILWHVLFGGAIITIGFTFFFGTENLRAQTLMTGALSLLVFAGLLTIVVIDRPFAGSIKVDPTALEYVLRDVAGVTPR
jgi:hypothetical protein